MAKILITGGAGYIGTRLTSHLLEKGHHVRVLDALIFTPIGLNALKAHPNFSQWQSRYEFIQEDIRNPNAVEKAMEGIDAVIHLAAISNDSTCDIDEVITRQVNFEATGLLLYIAGEKGVKRFINTSTGSVIGIASAKEMTERIEPDPITNYGKYKMMAEWLAFTASSKDFCTVNIRPATVCGYSPRQRFDLTINKLVADAYSKRHIVLHAGQQHRPSVGMLDVLNLYEKLLDVDASLINGRTFNFGFENHSILDLAKIIQGELQDLGVDIQVMESVDNRDFHITSQKISEVLGYQPVSSIQQEIQNLRKAFDANQFPNPEASEYYNVRNVKISRLSSCYHLFAR